MVVLRLARDFCAWNWCCCRVDRQTHRFAVSFSIFLASLKFLCSFLFPGLANSFVSLAFGFLKSIDWFLSWLDSHFKNKLNPKFLLNSFFFYIYILLWFIGKRKELSCGIIMFDTLLKSRFYAKWFDKIPFFSLIFLHSNSIISYLFVSFLFVQQNGG